MNVDERNKDLNEEPLHDNDVNRGPEEDDSEEDPNEDQEEELEEEGSEESEEYTEEECEETDEHDEEVNKEPVEDSETRAEVDNITNKNDTVPESNSISGDDSSSGKVCSRKQRRSRWDSGPTQDMEKKRKTRWSPLRDFVAIPKVVVEIQTLTAEFEELKRLLSSEVYDDRPVEKRSPSPPPEFDDLGFRTNTREVRLRDKLIQRYNEVRLLLTDKHPGFRPLTNDTPSKLLKKIYVPVKEYPEYKFAGLILGPEGKTVKRMEKKSGARILLRGAGFSKQRVDDDEDLYVLVMAETRESMDSAVAMIAKLLIPVQDDANYHKRAQLEELARLSSKKSAQEMKQKRLTSSLCRGCDGSERVHHYTCPHFESTSEIQLLDFPVAEKAICDSSELFVGSLPSTATSSQLLNLFSSFGPIKSARVAKKPINGESKGYGFVKFESPHDAAFALSCLNGHKWCDTVLVVELQEKQSALPDPSGSMEPDPQASFKTNHELGYKSGPTSTLGGQNHKLFELFSKKIPIPIGEDCGSTWVGRILGLKGKNIKKMEKESGARIRIRGNRSMGKPSNEDGELHVFVVAETQASLDLAVAMVEKLLTPVQEGTSDLKQAQPNPNNDYNYTSSKFEQESLNPKAWPGVTSSMLLNPQSSFQTKHGLGFHSSTDYKFPGNSSFSSFPGASQATDFQHGPTNFGKQASFSSSSELSKYPGAPQPTDFQSGPTNFGKQAPFLLSSELSKFPGASQVTDFHSWPTNFGKQGASQVTDFQSWPTNFGKQASYSSYSEFSKFPGALQVKDFQSGPTNFGKQAPFSSSCEFSKFPDAPQVTDFQSGPTNFGKQASFSSSSELSRFPDVHRVTDFQSGLTNFRKQASFPSSEISKFPGAPQVTDFQSEPTNSRKRASFSSSSAVSKFPGAPQIKDFRSGPTNFEFSIIPGAPQVMDYQSGTTDFTKQSSFLSFSEPPKFPPLSQSYFPEPASQFGPSHSTESEPKNMTWKTTSSAYNWDAYKW